MFFLPYREEKFDDTLNGMTKVDLKSSAKSCRTFIEQEDSYSSTIRVPFTGCLVDGLPCGPQSTYLAELEEEILAQAASMNLQGPVANRISRIEQVVEYAFVRHASAVEHNRWHFLIQHVVNFTPICPARRRKSSVKCPPGQ